MITYELVFPNRFIFYYTMIGITLLYLIYIWVTKDRKAWVYLIFTLALLYLFDYITFKSKIASFYFINKDSSIEHYYLFTILNSLLLMAFINALTPKQKSSKIKIILMIVLFLIVFIKQLDGLSFGFYIDSDLLFEKSFEMCTEKGLWFYIENTPILLSIFASSFLFEHD